MLFLQQSQYHVFIMSLLPFTMHTQPRVGDDIRCMLLKHWLFTIGLVIYSFLGFTSESAGALANAAGGDNFYD
jgi:hypothetical protein